MIGLSSPTHIALLLLIALLLFGAKRLPEIGRSLGHGMREFKDSVSGFGDHESHISQAERLPELGHSLGQGVREFKDSVANSDEHDRHTSQAALPPTDETASTHTTARDRDIA
jgi:sec-independent protein translocase protein TatA